MASPPSVDPPTSASVRAAAGCGSGHQIYVEGRVTAVARNALTVVVLVALLLWSCAPVPPPSMVTVGDWPCAGPEPDSKSEERVYVLRSLWRQVRGQPVRTWGVDLTERGVADIILVGPGSSTAVSADRGIGAAAAASASVIARFALDDGRRSGIEVLDGSTLKRIGLVSGDALRQRSSGTYADANSALANAVVAPIDRRRLLVVQGTPGLRGDSSNQPLGIEAMCVVDGLVTARRSLRAVEDLLEPCGYAPQIARRNGAAFITYPICRRVDGPSASAAADPLRAEPISRFFRITAAGDVTYFDLPVRRAVAPVGVGPAGDRVYVANPLSQELYAVDGRTGVTLWRSQYGIRPTIASPLKYAPAPNTILVAPDGARIFVATNPGADLATGIFIVDAATGRPIGQVADSLKVSGMAIAQRGVLYVSTPERAGALYSLLPELGAKPALVQDKLGEEISGVLVGD